MLSDIFIFVKFWNYNFCPNCEYGGKFRKDLIFRAEIFANISLKYFDIFGAAKLSVTPSNYISRSTKN